MKMGCFTAVFLKLINKTWCESWKRAYCARFYLSARMPDMSLYQKMLVFYAVMAAITAIITWFLSRDKKRIRFLSAVLVGATWPMSFPVALMFSLFWWRRKRRFRRKAGHLIVFCRLRKHPLDADIPRFHWRGYTKRPASRKRNGLRHAKVVHPVSSTVTSAVAPGH